MTAQPPRGLTTDETAKDSRKRENYLNNRLESVVGCSDMLGSARYCAAYPGLVCLYAEELLQGSIHSSRFFDGGSVTCARNHHQL